MNRVELVGNIVRDVELQKSAKGLSYCHFQIAVPRSFTNEEGKRESDFINVTAWRNLADLVGKYVHKGDKVGIVGKIQVRKYENENNETKFATEIIADEIEFLNTKKKVENDLKPAQKQDMDEMPF